MIQIISNIKKLFQRHKPDAHVPVSNDHGTRCILHVANLALFGVVVMLTIASTLIYFLVPITKVSKLNKMVDAQKVETDLDTESTQLPVQKVETGQDAESAQLPGMFSIDAKSATADPEKNEEIGSEAFSVINERNMFSQNRKEWVVRAVIPKSNLKNKKKVKKQRALAGKPKKIILHGVIIAGNMKKALINNPLKGVSKKKTLYIQEGDELEGYKVTSIEKDRITLDWNGEEIVIMLYSGLNDVKQDGNARKAKQGSTTLFDYNFKVVENIQTEKSFDDEAIEVANNNVSDKNPLYLVHKEPESFAMQAIEYSHSSGTVEVQEGLAELDVKSSVVEDAEVEISFDEEIITIAKNDVPDKNPLNLVYKEPESFAMPAFEYSHLSKAAETEEVVASLPDVKSNIVEDEEIEENIDDEIITVANKDVPDKNQLNLVYKDSESYSMPLFEYSHLTKPDETEQNVASLPDVESNNEGFSNREQETLEIEEPESVDLVAEEGLKNESLSGKTSEILLNGIVIVEARDIKKALVNIPMSHSNKGRTLSVEEGDSFEGYKVTSIETDRLRLDRYGEEFVLTAYSGLKHFKQGGNEENVKQVDHAKLDTKSNVVEDAEIEKSFDEEVITVANKDVPDKNQLNLVYKDSEYFSMPAFEYSHLSKAAETEEVVASLPDVKSNIVEDEEIEENIDDEIITVANKDVPDKNQLNLVYKDSESFSMPAFEYSHLSKEAETDEVVASLPDVESNNVGFYDEKQETLEIEEPGSIDLVAEEGLKNEFLPGKTSEILLNGIVIVEARDVKKALVNIPMSHSNKGRTLSVEEGDSFEGYKVTSIETDRLRLDRYGEEFVLTAYSGLKHIKQGGNEGNVKQVDLAKLDTKSNVVEDAEIEKTFDEEVVKVVNKEVSDKNQLNLVYKESEYFSMPAFEYSHLSKAAETEEVVESLPDVKSNNEGFPEEKQETLEIEETGSTDLVADEGLKQEPLSGKPLEILLNGIVIVEARDVKKALVNIPMSHSNKGRTLSVEEGDSFEGYKVTSIEPDRLRLDWQGEEVVITTYSGLNHIKQGGNEGNAEQVGLAKLDTKLKVIEDVKIDEGFDQAVVTVEQEDVHDESSLSLEYKEPEYLSMASFKDSELSETDETQENDLLFPFCSFPD